MTPPDSPRSDGSRRTTGRRAVLAGVGVGLGWLGGCASLTGDAGSEDVPTPVALDGGKQDDFGGMVIGEHAGPNGQIFYRDQAPHGSGTPAWFHTLVHGLFPYYFEHERLGWEAVAVYVTDYSLVDYELLDQGDRTFISTYTAASTFGDARTMRYVAGSEVHGGMGPELIPFGEAADAEAFRGEHGGRLVAFDDVSADLLNSLRRDGGQ